MQVWLLAAHRGPFALYIELREGLKVYNIQYTVLEKGRAFLPVVPHQEIIYNYVHKAQGKTEVWPPRRPGFPKGETGAGACGQTFLTRTFCSSQHPLSLKSDFHSTPGRSQRRNLFWWGCEKPWSIIAYGHWSWHCKRSEWLKMLNLFFHPKTLCHSKVVDMAASPSRSWSIWEVFQPAGSGHRALHVPDRSQESGSSTELWITQPRCTPLVKRTLRGFALPQEGNREPDSRTSDVWAGCHQNPKEMKARQCSHERGGVSVSWLFSQLELRVRCEGRQSQDWARLAQARRQSPLGSVLEGALMHFGRCWNESLSLELPPQSQYDSYTADHKNQMSRR